MQRMTKAGWVKHESKRVHGTRTAAYYTLTKRGADEGQRTIDFYTGGQSNGDPTQ